MQNAKSVGVLVIGIATLLAFIGMVAVAEDGLDIEIGAEATILPDFTSDLWVDLDWSLNGLSIGSTTTVTVFPAFVANETLVVEYGFGWASLGATTSVDLYPLAFVGFTVYADAGFYDTAFGEDGLLSLEFSLSVPILPAFALVVSMDLDASYWLLSLWSGVDFDILAPGIDGWIGAEIRLLDLALDNGSLTADWGSEMNAMPAFGADMWFDVTFGMGDVTLTSQTDFALTPFALTQQRFDIELDIDGLSIFVWGGYSTTLDFFAGIGFTYDLP